MEKMMICPRCGKKYPRLLALSRKDNKTMICDECGTAEALDSLGLEQDDPIREEIMDEIYKNQTPQERTRAAVMRTGNKWAIENFNSTH